MCNRVLVFSLVLSLNTVLIFSQSPVKTATLTIDAPRELAEISGENLIITGSSSVSNGIIKIYINNIETKRLKTDAFGYWRHTYSYLENGQYEIRATLLDKHFCTLATAQSHIRIANRPKNNILRAEAKLRHLPEKRQKQIIQGSIDIQQDGAGNGFIYRVKDQHVIITFGNEFAQMPLVLLSAQGATGLAYASLVKVSEKSIDILCNRDTDKINFRASF